MALKKLRTFALVQDALQWLRERRAQRLVVDSRQVQPGDAFVALPGAASDGRRFVPDAVASGAAACLVDAAGAERFEFAGDAVAAIPQLKEQLGHVAAAFENHPSARMDVVAFTGTNGKTSSTWWFAQASTLLGSRAAQIGTLGIGEPPLDGSAGQWQPTGLTTPDPVTLHHALAELADRGVQRCGMEASSIGIQEQRLAGLQVAVAVFGNLSQDHLDYHGDMSHYWAAKRKLFDLPGLRAAVVNLDDVKGQALAAELVELGWSLRTGAGRSLWTTSQHGPARLQATEVAHTVQGLSFVLQEAGEPPVRVSTPFVGAYNLENLLGVVAALRSLGHPLAVIAPVLSRLQAVPGRLERLGGDGAPTVLIDYAHTPDALDKVLRTLQPLARAQGGRLWCVFGCGGDRDRSKRAPMGAAATAVADAVIVTSDNPRSEDPAQIARDILQGVEERVRLSTVGVELDRALAVQSAVAQAQVQDLILVAGKGHEAYQEVAGVRHPMRDADLVRRALQWRSQTPVAGLPLMRLADVAAALPGSRLVGDGQTPIHRVHTDTRSLRSGDLFVALRGERFDGHQFLAQAKASGASAALAEAGLEAANLPGVEVDDTLGALQTLARAWRAQQTLPVIGVTGSNGKTTVTQMTASILRVWWGERAAATRGNLNNHIGVPLTVLTLRGQGPAAHRAAVVELGMNHPGEIAALSAMAQPTVAVVNNAQREHQEFMHTVEAVARENGAVLEALPPDGVAVFPATDAYAPLWTQLAGDRRMWRFAVQLATADGVLTGAGAGPVAGGAVEAEVQMLARWKGSYWELRLRTPVGDCETTLALPGAYNVHNAAAAAAAALAAGAPMDAVAEGVASFRPVQGRSMGLTVSWRGQALQVVDDSYNANPDSVRAAIDLLAGLPGPHLLVLGDMGEVGTEGPRFHAEVGLYARERGLENVWTVGEACIHTAKAYGPEALHFGSVPALVAALAELPVCASVLVKGSRFMRMERVVQALQTPAEVH